MPVFTSGFWVLAEAVVVVLGAVLGTYQFVHRVLTKSRKRDTRLDTIESELKSLHESFNRIDKNIETLSLEQSRHLGFHEGLKTED